MAAIVDAIWPDNPPGSVRNRVQVLVSSLRRKLDRAGATGVLETAARGYRLNAAKASADVQEFDRLATAGKRLAADGAIEAAAQAYGRPSLCGEARHWMGSARFSAARRRPN